MNFILTDGTVRQNLLPLTYTRPVGEIRVGITTLKEKWEFHLESPISYHTENYLQNKYPEHLLEDNVFIAANYIPNNKVVQEIKALKPNQVLLHEEEIVAYRSAKFIEEQDLTRLQKIEGIAEISAIRYTYDIFTMNPEMIKQDFEWKADVSKARQLPEYCTHFGSYPVFVEEGATIYPGTFNTEKGPIYIGKNATIMEGCLVRGPFALCESAILKMGAKIYEGSTFGPYSKVGGEVGNSVLFAYSNKGHEGYLGNSVLGEWCNLGADTNTSNLKNNYAPVKLWDYRTERFQPTGLQFCGLIMGDHSKAGINTMFNTGTVVGVSSNIFGTGYPRNFIPSFAWGGAGGFTEYRTDKAFEAATAMMGRKEIPFDKVEQEIMEAVFEQTKPFRSRF